MPQAQSTGQTTGASTYKGTVPADGKWQPIATKLNGCHCFRVLAMVGHRGTGRYAIVHALALSTFGKSHDRIAVQQAHYAWYWNKMKLRFKGDTFDYRLEIKTMRNYGAGVHIQYELDTLMEGFTVQ